MALQTLLILDAFEPDSPSSRVESTGAPRTLHMPSVLRALADLRSRASTLTWAASDSEYVVPLQPDSISLR